MKTLFLTLFMVVSTTLLSQSITVLQINADWNYKNTMIGLDRLRGCTYKYADLENQPESIKQSISSVPTIYLIVDGKPKKVWVAVIDLKINATKEETFFEEIQSEINKYLK